MVVILYIYYIDIKNKLILQKYEKKTVSRDINMIESLSGTDKFEILLVALALQNLFIA